MASECKGGGKFVGKWSVSARNTTPCPVCRLPHPVRPYGGRYKIADHHPPKGAKAAPPAPLGRCARLIHIFKLLLAQLPRIPCLRLMAAAVFLHAPSLRTKGRVGGDS